MTTNSLNTFYISTYSKKPLALALPEAFLDFKFHYLICVDNDLALFLVGAGDDEHVVEAGGVVDQTLVLVGGQHIAGARLQEVNSALVHSQPEILWPVGGEGLLELVQFIEETFQ